MNPLSQAKYLSACDDCEVAVTALARARMKAVEALAEALAAGGGDEARMQANCYGTAFLDRAITQSCGAKDLVSLFIGGPERVAQVGVRVGGDVLEIMKGRLGVTQNPVLAKGIDNKREVQTEVPAGVSSSPPEAEASH